MTMKIIFIAVTISFILLAVLFGNLWQRYNTQAERLQQQAMIIEWLQDIEIQRLMEHVRKVMQGEIIYDTGESVLATYSNNVTRDRVGDDLYSIESDLKIIDLRLDEYKGQAIVTYFIRYLNSDGEVLMATSADPIMPDRWVLEKQAGEWIIVEINTVLEFKTGELGFNESILWRE